MHLGINRILADCFGRGMHSVEWLLVPFYFRAFIHRVFTEYMIILLCFCNKVNLLNCSDVLQHPYPTEDEKRQIAAQTNLSLLQVNNWLVSLSCVHFSPSLL